MENNFEDHIRDTMNDPSEFPYEERLWQDMESRFKNDGRTKPFLWFIGKLPLLLLAILGTGLAIFFYAKQYKTTQKMAEMERQFQTQKSPKIDDVLEKRVTIIYDTIYNSIAINQFEKQESKPIFNQWTSFYNRINTLSSEDFVFDVSDKSISRRFSSLNIPPINYSFQSLLSIANRFSENEEGSHLKDTQVHLNLDAPMQTLPSLTYSFLKVEQFDNLPTIQIQQTKRRQKRKMSYYLSRIEPTGYAFSGTMGTFASLNLGGNGFNLKGSAHGEVGFGKGFAFTIGVEYFSNDFNLKIEEDEQGVPNGFPDLSPNNAEDALQKINGDFNYLQIPFGIKYIINPVRHFYPYLGLGILANKATKSRLEYEYQDASTLFIYPKSQGQLLPNTFDLNAYWATLGFQVRLTKHWSLLMEGSSQFDWRNGTYKYEDLKILKMSTGFQYKF